MLTGQDPEQLLNTALAAISSFPDWRKALDCLPVPIYTTDPQGLVTYWNQSCVEFAGREPKLGRDHWCVTWKIFSTSGERMRHDECPTADAIRQRRIVRNCIAIAQRPDGSRRAFQAYPTPLFDLSGSMTGAINMLIDVTEEQSEALHEQAKRCRRLAEATYDRTTTKILADMALGFDHTADTLATP